MTVRVLDQSGAIKYSTEPSVVQLIGSPVMDGQDGEPGSPGPIGATGATGATGADGAAGTIGPPGLDGNDADSLWPWGLSNPTQTTEYTTTTTGNIDDLDFGTASLIRMNNASLATIRGLANGIPGQRVTIVSIGAGQVDLSHQNAGSAAANRLINFVTVGATPLAAGTGTATYQYDGTTLRWRLVAHEQGAYIVPAFVAGDYTGSGSMTVTVASGDVARFAYKVFGKAINIEMQLQQMTIGGTPDTYVQRVMPGSFSIAGTRLSPLSTFDNSTWNASYASLANASTTIVVARDLSGNNWTAGTDTAWVLGNLTFELT